SCARAHSCSCSTSPPRRSTLKPSTPCSTATQQRRAGAARTPRASPHPTAASPSSSPTGSAPCAWPTSSWCCAAHGWSRRARTRRSWRRAGTTRSCTASRPRRIDEQEGFTVSMWLLLAISVVVRAAGVLRPQARVAPDSGSCRTDVRVEGTGPSSAFAVTETADGLLIPVQVAGRPDTLWLLFDSGAGHTVLDRNVARRLDLRATSQGTISGVGTGATAVDIVSRVALSLPGVRIEHVDLALAAIPGPTHSRRPYT